MSKLSSQRSQPSSSFCRIPHPWHSGVRQACWKGGRRARVPGDPPRADQARRSPPARSGSCAHPPGTATCRAATPARTWWSSPARAKPTQRPPRLGAVGPGAEPGGQVPGGVAESGQGLVAGVRVTARPSPAGGAAALCWACRQWLRAPGLALTSSVADGTNRSRLQHIGTPVPPRGVVPAEGKREYAR